MNHTKNNLLGLVSMLPLPGHPQQITIHNKMSCSLGGNFSPTFDIQVKKRLMYFFITSKKSCGKFIPKNIQNVDMKSAQLLHFDFYSLTQNIPQLDASTSSSRNEGLGSRTTCHFFDRESWRDDILFNSNCFENLFK